MKIQNTYLQSVIRRFLGVPKAPDEVSEKGVLVFNALPMVVYNNSFKAYEFVYSGRGRILTMQVNVGTRITTATTVTLSANLPMDYSLVGVNVDVAGGAGSTITFRDSGGTTLLVLDGTKVGMVNIPALLCHDVVTTGVGAPSLTVIGIDQGVDATETLVGV